jgi:hypothetical protein
MFGDQMNQRQEREDALLTNEAITEALRGGSPTSSNRRVDANALQLAVQSQGEFDELKQTSDLTQEGLGIENRMNAFKESKQEDLYDLNRRATELGMDADEQTLATSEFQHTMDQYDFTRQKELDRLDDTQRGNTDRLDAFAQSFEDRVFQDELAGNANPTQEEINAARVRARARTQGPEGRQAARRELVNLGASERAWNASAWGRRDVLAEATEAALTKSREEARDKRIEREGLWAVEFGEGDYSSTVADASGNLGPASKEVVEAQKRIISTTDKALQHLSRSGVNITDLAEDKDSRAIVDEVRAAFPTASMFTPVIKSFTESDGTVDLKGLRKALREGQRDIVLSQAGLNSSGGRASVAGGSTGGYAGGFEPGKRSPQAVAHAASTKEQAEKDLAQLASDVKASMDRRRALLEEVGKLKSPKAQAIADQFQELFTTGIDPGRAETRGSFFAGAKLGGSGGDPLGIEKMQKKFDEFDNWYQHVNPSSIDTAKNSSDLTQQLLQRMLESE